MRLVSLLRVPASIVLLALAPSAHSQGTALLFPSDVIPHSGCYAPRCFEVTAALDNGTAIAALQPLITVSIRSPVGWIRQQDIYNPDVPPPRNYEEGERRVWPPFASAIGLSGNELLIAGSSRKYNFKDVVYVFSRANGVWTHTQALALLRPAGFEQTIVTHIAIDRDIALIAGTRYDDQNPSAAFVQIDFYVRLAAGKWERRGSFKPPAGSSAEFPASMDLSGNFAILGDPAAQGTGRAYLFEYTSKGWLLRQSFASTASSMNTRFGSIVAISGNTVAVTAPEQAGVNSYQRGAVHFFSRNLATWRPLAVVFEPPFEASPDAGDIRMFGTSMSLDGQRAIVGTRGISFVENLPHAYLLEPLEGWRVVGQLVNYDAPYRDRVFLSGSTAIVEGVQEWGDRDGFVYELPLIGQLP